MFDTTLLVYYCTENTQNCRKAQLHILSNGTKRAPQPVLVRVDRRQQPVYEEPTPTRKAQSSAMLLAIAVAVGATLAFALSFVVSSAVGSITGLLK